MFHRRGVLVAYLLLTLILLGFVARFATGVAAVRAGSAPSTASRVAPVPNTPADRALASVQSAFNAGDVSALCQPGRLVDAAVVAEQNAQPGGCRGEVETLIGHTPAMRLTVHSLAMRPGLVQATVKTARGTTAPVDLARHGRGWVLSFTNGGDPLPALAGTE